MLDRYQAGVVPRLAAKGFFLLSTLKRGMGGGVKTIPHFPEPPEPRRFAMKVWSAYGGVVELTEPPKPERLVHQDVLTAEELFREIHRAFCG